MRISRGDTLIPFAPQIMQDASTSFNLTGYTVSVSIVDQSNQSIGGGVMTVDNATQGQCHYNFVDGDVDEVGTFELHTKYTQTSTGKFAHLDPEPLIIEWAP